MLKYVSKKKKGKKLNSTLSLFRTFFILSIQLKQKNIYLIKNCINKKKKN